VEAESNSSYGAAPSQSAEAVTGGTAAASSGCINLVRSERDAVRETVRETQWERR
jgi:hypothetical protein